MTRTHLGAITFKALGINARRILDFLMYEHLQHAGRENGNLAASYRQLEAWGVTAADVRKGLAELTATGFVRVTSRGMRQAGGGEPSRYALTWLPTRSGSSDEAPPTQDWDDIIKGLEKLGVGNVIAARKWLKAEVAAHVRKKSQPTSQLSEKRLADDRQPAGVPPRGDPPPRLSNESAADPTIERHLLYLGEGAPPIDPLHSHAASDADSIPQAEQHAAILDEDVI
ncbi:hypothetical protein [Phenylobacterium sp.]|uniref:hypothetical protein n=1 Tax=Phenylobacterium sp. TaxID=1871053 RepID=UPI00356493E4